MDILIFENDFTIQSVSGRNKCMWSSSPTLYYGHVQSCVIQNSFASLGTSFVIVVLTRLNVSEPKY